MLSFGNQTIFIWGAYGASAAIWLVLIIRALYMRQKNDK